MDPVPTPRMACEGRRKLIVKGVDALPSHPAMNHLKHDHMDETVRSYWDRPRGGRWLHGNWYVNACIAATEV
jgi:hypothetical protein